MENTVSLGNALDFYDQWQTPTTIISDGAYGINGFPGDPKTPDGLADWYEPHIAAWTKAATTSTSLWFWNTEVGWATVHPVLIRYGWKYIQLITWDKGIGHIAGNVNGDTIRRFPTVTEVCGLYVRPQEVKRIDGETSIQEWLRAEWKRAGFAMSEANIVCGVKNAASRKWLTSDHLWYMPPFDMFEKLKIHADTYGDATGAPYFDLGNNKIEDRKVWAKLRSTWNHQHGFTNVWSSPALRNNERIKGEDGKSLHTNQKPLELMKRQIIATTDIGDVLWEPFGGLVSASVAARELGRNSYAADVTETCVVAGRKRIKDTLFLDM